MKAILRPCTYSLNLKTQKQFFRRHFSKSLWTTELINELPASGIRVIMSKADELQSQGNSSFQIIYIKWI